MKENFEKLKKYLYELFTTHPKENGETYGAHFEFAFVNGIKGIFIGLLLTIHAIFPFLFTKTATSMALKWQETMRARTEEKKL